jgi:hypothetical protein
LRNRLQIQAELLKDTLLEWNYKKQQGDLLERKEWLSGPECQQRLAEYREILSVPALIEAAANSNGRAQHYADSLRAEAGRFISFYDEKKKEADSLKQVVDSLQTLYHNMQAQVQSFRALLNRPAGSAADQARLEEALRQSGLAGEVIPARYRWLLNVQKAAIGRSLVNQSELTSKNISLNGINFEYASLGFYAAVAAGRVDYRYRDFNVPASRRSPQYMVLLKAGCGRPEGNHFYLSFYKGRKQAFFTAGQTAPAMNISGVAGELKYQIVKGTWLTMEAAGSMSPDLRTSPVSYAKFDLKDKKNKALSFQLRSFIPATRTVVDALYKYTGANFQSFSSFQTQSELRSWHVRADQPLLKNRLRMTAALRSNDFSNPYIIQSYRSNTVFKSLQLTYRAPRMPVVSVGYQPVSQLTRSGDQVLDNQFNSLQANITHYYKLGTALASSSFLFNRFYNDRSDTGFAYYNATNIFFNQDVSFKFFSLGMALSRSVSSDYELNIFDGSLQLNPRHWLSLGFGVKVNNFNREITRASAYGNLRISYKKWGTLSLVMDNGYLPGTQRKFIKNDFFNLVFTQVL